MASRNDIFTIMLVFVSIEKVCLFIMGICTFYNGTLWLKFKPKKAFCSENIAVCIKIVETILNIFILELCFSNKYSISLHKKNTIESRLMYVNIQPYHKYSIFIWYLLMRHKAFHPNSLSFCLPTPAVIFQHV